MVKCPKCSQDMHYDDTDVDAIVTDEVTIQISADVKYHCINCDTTVAIHHDAEVKLI